MAPARLCEHWGVGVWLTELRRIQVSMPSSTVQPTTETTWFREGLGANSAYTLQGQGGDGMGAGKG